MAKTKAELLEEAKTLDLEVTEANTVVEINEAIKAATDKAEASAEEGHTAKAGKRSAKAIAEAEEKQAKEERKADRAEADAEQKPKQAAKPARSRLERRSRKYKTVQKTFNQEQDYSVKEAIEHAIKSSYVKFDATAELHIRLNVDPRHADQNIRDSIVLPAGTGKTLKIAVLADEDQLAKAGKIDVELAGEEVVLGKLAKNEIGFDVLIATPNMMQKLAKFAKLLGPKGLMPNPKSGTVTADVAKAVAEAKAGRVEYRVDSTGIVHVPFGKLSFGADKLQTNLDAIITSIKGNKPSSIKGPYVKSVFITTTMGPSVKVANSEIA